MNKIALYFFAIALGIILGVICLAADNEAERMPFQAALVIYVSAILLFRNISAQKTSGYGFRFRRLLTGIAGLVIGLLLLIIYLTSR